ncbi:MAG: hypothetical protein E7555_03720 [Ruminococcaceae bacterium]|nr:hypothetical protein [Oscillospiraceae bacterium]
MKIKAKKGCINPDCVMCKKKVHAHKEDSFCPRCGNELSFVCEKCHTFLPDSSKKLCLGCQAKKDDAKVKSGENLAKIGTGVLSVAATASGILAAVAKKKK